VECDIVGWTFSQQCCPYKDHVNDCGSEGASWGTIQRAVNHFTGKSFSRPNGPLDQKTLDATLQAGNPVLIEVGSDSGPNHVVTLHGCDGKGGYWFHDPERDVGEYLQGSTETGMVPVDYHWLLNMCMAWVDKANPKLVSCDRSAPKGADEMFRIKWKWWDTLYVNSQMTVV